MKIASLSCSYTVRRLTENDIPDIVSLCSKNNLFYKYCPPFVSEQSIRDDMSALPDGKSSEDKYYLGYYERDKLVAVLDLILRYPDSRTAFIGFFMTDISVQGQGIGSLMIDELCSGLRNSDFSSVRLGWVKGNPQSSHFWKKNGFSETGITYDTGGYTVIVAQKILKQ